MRGHRVIVQAGPPEARGQTPLHRTRCVRLNRGSRRAICIAGFLGLFAASESIAQRAGGRGEVSLTSVVEADSRDGHRTEQNGLPSRMDQFLRAVQRRNVDSISAFFPRRGDWTYQRTKHVRDGRRVGRWKFGPEDTPRAIRSGPLESSFTIDIEAQPVGTLIHQLAFRSGRWHQLPGLRFVPPGGGPDSGIFVTWRREDGAWVISSFGDECYGDTKLPPWCC
jgi:hypothetical protein